MRRPCRRCRCRTAQILFWPTRPRRSRGVGDTGTGAGGGVVMDFYDVLDQVVDLLQRRSRVTYNALKLQFHLDDDQLAVLKDELLYAYPQVIDDAGRGLRWTGDPAATQAPLPASQAD